MRSIQKAKHLTTLLLALTISGAFNSVAADIAPWSPPGDGKGVDSNLLWPSPGPSNFPTLQASDIVPHAGVTFSGLFGIYRKPLGVERADGSNEEWVVKDVYSADFLWAFGLFDFIQLGLSLPVILHQEGVGSKPFQPADAEDADYALASSALRDLRFNVKTRFLGGDAPNPDRRDFGLAVDIGLSVPTGDELNFAGDNGAVLFPTAILDFHRCKLSAAVNLGARLRFDKSGDLANLHVGHQGILGAGVTGHYLKRRLLLSAEGVATIEFDGFDRLGFEYRGGLGYIPDDDRSVTLWLAAGSAGGTGDLLGTPIFRFLVGLTYAPGTKNEVLDAL